MCRNLAGGPPVLTKAKGSFQGGSCADRRRVWGQGTCLLYQEDAAALLSPDLFDTYILPHTALVLRPFDYTVIHTHSDSLRIVSEALCHLPELRAIEVLLDPSGPQERALLPLFKRILRDKSLIICGEMTLEQIKLFWRELPHAGLCLQPKVNTQLEGNSLYQEMLALDHPIHPSQVQGSIYAN